MTHTQQYLNPNDLTPRGTTAVWYVQTTVHLSIVCTTCREKPSSSDLVQEGEVCLPGYSIIGPVGILILHLEPYDGPTIGALQGNQDLKQSLEVP